jgi:hypothetical protein
MAKTDSMKIATLCLLLLFTSFAIIGLSHPGSLDRSFSPNGKIETKMGITFSDLNYITQCDGKILAVGPSLSILFVQFD